MLEGAVHCGSTPEFESQMGLPILRHVAGFPGKITKAALKGYKTSVC